MEKSTFFVDISSSFIFSTSIDILSVPILLLGSVSSKIKLSFCLSSSIFSIISSFSISISESRISCSLALKKLLIKLRVPEGVTLNNIAIDIINENIDDSYTLDTLDRRSILVFIKACRRKDSYESLKTT